VGGSTYGSSNAPVDPGSGGGAAQVSGWGGYGGGLIRVEAGDTVIVDGSLLANGGPAVANNYVGPGSGGAIFIKCKYFKGSGNGQLQANGRNATSEETATAARAAAGSRSGTPSPPTSGSAPHRSAEERWEEHQLLSPPVERQRRHDRVVPGPAPTGHDPLHEVIESPRRTVQHRFSRQASEPIRRVCSVIMRWGGVALKAKRSACPGSLLRKSIVYDHIAPRGGTRPTGNRSKSLGSVGPAPSPGGVQQAPGTPWIRRLAGSRHHARPEVPRLRPEVRASRDYRAALGMTRQVGMT